MEKHEYDRVRRFVIIVVIVLLLVLWSGILIMMAPAPPSRVFGITQLRPIADGGTNEWTAKGCGPHYQCVDDPQPGQDTHTTQLYKNASGAFSYIELHNLSTATGAVRGYSIDSVSAWVWYALCRVEADPPNLTGCGVPDPAGSLQFGAGPTGLECGDFTFVTHQVAWTRGWANLTSCSTWSSLDNILFDDICNGPTTICHVTSEGVQVNWSYLPPTPMSTQLLRLYIPMFLLFVAVLLIADWATEGRTRRAET